MYKNWYFLFSTLTSSILWPEGNVLSITFPVVTLLILVLTNAGPFPGFTCKNSITLKISLLSLIQRPFFISEVEATKERDEILLFIKNSQRGIMKGYIQN